MFVSIRHQAGQYVVFDIYDGVSFLPSSTYTKSRVLPSA